MRQLFVLLGLFPLFAVSQENGKGIQWAQRLTWDQVQQKAKRENKYIFVDCYATWCGPCKMMDRYIYPLDSVGDYFNKQFISVRLQMDITPNDNEEVVSWRKDVEAVRKQYRVNAYPSFLFISPQGLLTSKVEGFRNPADFLWIGRNAVEPGRVYVDPLERFYQLKDQYEQGERKYDSLYLVVKTAIKEEKVDTVIKLIIKDLNQYLTIVPKSQLFTRERIEFMTSITTNPDSKWFPFFYKDSKKINTVMEDNNYAQKVVEFVITHRIACPYLKVEYPAGMELFSTGVIPVDAAEADWVTLENMMKDKFSAYYVKRSMLSSKMIWYKRHWNMTKYNDVWLQFLDKYGVNSHPWTKPGFINDHMYNIVFKTEKDKAKLEKAVNWMREVVRLNPKFHYLDTYASLLYKTGNCKEALVWEKRALQQALKNNRTDHASFFQAVIDKMQKGEKLEWIE